MSHTLAVLLLALCCIAGLVLVPLGLPGLWVMVGGVLGYGALTGFRTIGVATIAIVLGLAFLGELLEWWVGFGLTERYGGSRRSGWGALVGGIAGAMVGVPVPIVGSVIGAFTGAFVGAALFEYSVSRTPGVAGRTDGGGSAARTARSSSRSITAARTACPPTAGCCSRPTRCGSSSPISSRSSPRRTCRRRRGAEGGPQRYARHQYIGDDHRPGVYRHSVRRPRQRGNALDAPQRDRILAEVGGHEQRCREPSDPVVAHLLPLPSQATSGGAESVSRIVNRSVWTLSHSWSA